MPNATNLSRAATVSAASGSQRQLLQRRGSFTVDRSDSKSFSDHSLDNKRVSRDDLALILKSTRKGNVTAFHIPIHGRLPSPDLSPRTSSLSTTTLVRTSTPDSVGDTGEIGVIAVGMAIGSPSHMGDSVPAPWNPQNRAMNAAVDAPESIQESEPKPASEPVEEHDQKHRKWGIFRSKSKRGTRPEKPQRSLTDSNASTTSLTSSGLPSSVSGEPSSRRPPKHKPIVIRSHTEPTISQPTQVAEESPLPTQTPSQATFSPSKLGKEKATTEIKATKETKPKEPGSGGMGRKMSLRAFRGDSSKKRAQRVAVPPSSPPPMPAIPRSLLDVEIPDVKMDRYSVMFNSVLQPQQGSASSLLARRQANLDHLKMVKDAITENRDFRRPRRATSPQPSPNFVPTGDQMKPLPSPRFRANTSPAPYDSASFVQTPEILTHEAKAQVVTLSRTEVQHGKFASQATHYQPVLVSKFNRRPSGTNVERISLVPKIHPSPPRAVVSPEKFSRQNSPYTPVSGAVPVSPEHTDDEKDVHVAKGRNTSPSQASWQMASPPASVTSSNAGASRRFSPSSSLSSPKKKSSDTDAQEALRNAVEISIARQISVSQQQRKMLHPLKSNPSVRHRRNGSPATSGPGYIPIEEGERLAETRSSTPVLVNPRELTNSPDAYQTHRKSEMVIFEDS
ncbi:hypothetical protein FPOAC2_09330 [Fusarium poae]|uniref:Uncharacterized protein n=1 Tax=Fusarium poae TaxID=36050 RepID=A0A1B8ANP8_FUSPO|nr:hypothetical protein FPOAC1_009390 [Fusarium poae]KAG8669987.1 hypothetical protein FPOAC1_009390 [Fusarium poae]OBS22193.1 hypothetical protein FPOA_08529 [Fusarium poae]